MNSYVIETHNESETEEFAQKCAAEVKNGEIILLQGTLGVGKTVFARRFIQHLMGREVEVPSPTFTLVQTYEKNDVLLWHFDLYRLEEPSEIYELGWEEALNGSIMLIEWPERLGVLKPDQYTEINIESTGTTSRKITVKNIQP